MKTKTIQDYTDLAVQKACELLAINSPAATPTKLRTGS